MQVKPTRINTEPVNDDELEIIKNVNLLANHIVHRVIEILMESGFHPKSIVVTSQPAMPPDKPYGVFVYHKNVLVFQMHTITSKEKIRLTPVAYPNARPTGYPDIENAIKKYFDNLSD